MKCPHCHGLGYDASGYQCTCQPEQPDNSLAWLLGVFFALLVVRLIVHICLGT